MGLLDDAIREHLDLKRRRGADPSEIERAEREALGPVRRGPDPVAAEDDPFAGAAAGEPSASAVGDDWEPEAVGHHGVGGEPDDFFEDPHEHDGHGHDGHDHEPYDEPAPARGGGRLSRFFGRRGGEEHVHEHDPVDEHMHADEELVDEHLYDEPLEPHGHEPLHDDVARRPLAPMGDETVEYDVEHALADEPHPHPPPESKPPSGAKPAAAGEHDALEETPDFLQDTPDHDRLWFEQKPPRDFDFDH